jgi:hypothetical protein
VSIGELFILGLFGNGAPGGLTSKFPGVLQ